MFIRFWILWMMLGLSAAVWVFAWAVRTRQFTQGRRAALIPFDDWAERGAAAPARAMSWGVRAIVLVGALSLLITLATLVAALWPARPDRSREKAVRVRSTHFSGAFKSAPLKRVLRTWVIVSAPGHGRLHIGGRGGASDVF
jgi:cbb3-type cytochrome oxidase subunit 3